MNLLSRWRHDSTDNHADGNAGNADDTGQDAVGTALRSLGEMRSPFLAAFADIQERVVADGIDLVILCARRLPCLYQVLLDNDHRGIEGPLVVSDRFLDVACEWKWSNVLIVDDTVVLGTTLSNLYEDVASRVSKFDADGNVSTYAICVDEDRQARYLLDRINLTAKITVPEAQVEQFSRDVVTTLFHNQRPFFSDFPVTGKVRLPLDAYTAFVTAREWSLADVTSSLVALDDQRAHVQLPTPSHANELLSRLPEPVHALVSAFKLRSWVTRVDADTVEVTFVPLALLGGALVADLDHALTTLGSALGAPEVEKLLVDDLKGDAKHRLLQMFTSVHLLASAIPPDIAKVLGEQNAWVDANYTRLYFGNRTDDAVDLFARIVAHAPDAPAEADREVSDVMETPQPSELLEDDELHRLLWASRDLLTTTANVEGLFERPSAGDVTKVGVVASHAISALFGYISVNFEAGQQNDIRDLDDHDEYVARYVTDRGARVLQQAFTMNELTEALIGDAAAASRWSRDVVSLGIDIGNDLGIVVPTTRIDDYGTIYRAYRLGETAPMASKPLMEWTPDEGPDALDEFSGEIANGEPALSSTAPFKLPEPRDPEVLHDPSGQTPSYASVVEMAKLDRVHYAAYPGTPRLLFAGTVTTGVSSERTFEAVVTSLPHGVQSRMIVNLDQVPVEETDLVTVGATFRWKHFERSGVSGKDRTSRIKFERPVLIPEGAAESAEQRFGWLAEYQPVLADGIGPSAEWADFRVELPDTPDTPDTPGAPDTAGAPDTPDAPGTTGETGPSSDTGFDAGGRA